MDIAANFTIKQWQEETYSEVESAGKLTCASVEYHYQGRLSGIGVVKYVMAYDRDRNARYYGLERFSGELDGNAGSFVMQHQGVFAGGKIDQESLILEKSGTDGLLGLRGSARLQTGHQESYQMNLTVELSD